MADNLANDDKQNPPVAGERNNTLNNYTPPGGTAPVQATPTSQSGKSDTAAAASSKSKPGKRLQNPLANFSSYTYQISLYMITPDAYKAFIESGRKNLNAINNITAAGTQTIIEANQQAATREAQINSGFVQGVGERGRTTSPPTPSAPTSPASSSRVTAPTTSIVRPSPPPAWVAAPPSKPNAGWPGTDRRGAAATRGHVGKVTRGQGGYAMGDRKPEC